MEPSASRQPAKLLVVDDDEGLLFLMVDVLRREGFDVEGCESGEKTIAWLTGQSVDLLLLDLKLGDLPATEVLERLREQERTCPFIIVTGHGDERTVVELMKTGALDYVMKDSGMLELLPGVVRRALTVVERDRKLGEANEAIRQSEERHQHVVQTALDGFFRIEQSGVLLELNEALCLLLGTTAPELIQRNVFEIQGAAFNEEVRSQLSKLATEGAARCFTRLTRRDGTQLEVELSLRSDGSEVFGFVHDISEQRRLEREVLRTVLEERSRIGRELHDGLGQQLTALELMVHIFVRDLKSSAPACAKSAAEITRYIRTAVAHTRELAHGLTPVAVEADGLMLALSELARMTRSAGVKCEFECPDPVHIEDSAVASHLYRIAQEAVTNALKHAKARSVVVRLENRGERIELTIEDNGRGLPRSKSRKAGLGLQLIQHRARLIAGHATVESLSRKGVRIVCSVPKPL